MEKVRCPEHGAVCLLKTGTREGPNKGRSFYVCPANRCQACLYSRPTDLPPSHCLLHDDARLDLQALVKQDSGSYRLYYRCVKSEGKKFCGSVPWKEESKCKVTARCDLPAEKTEKPPRNPFKVINDGPRPGVWKQVIEERERSSEETGEAKADENLRKSGEAKADENLRKSGEAKADVNLRKSGEAKADENLKKSGEVKTGENLKKSGEVKTGENLKKSGEVKTGENLKKSGEVKTGENLKKSGEVKTGENLRKSGEAKADENLRKSGEAKADENLKKSGEVKTGDNLKKSGEVKTGENLKKSVEVKAGENLRKSGEVKTGENLRKSGEAKTGENLRKSGEVKTGENLRKSGEAKTGENLRKSGEAKTGENLRKSGEVKTGENLRKSGEEAKHQNKEKNPNDRARKSLEDKTSSQGLKNSSEETRPQNNATDLSSDRERKICEADNSERPGRTSAGGAAIVEKRPEDRTWSCEVRRTQPPSDGGQKGVEDGEPSFEGWREKELPAGLKIKKKLPEETVQREGEASGVTRITPSDPGQESADDDDVVFVGCQPGKKEVSALRTSGGGKQRTITSFPGFTPQTEGPSPAALHAMLSTQLQQKKATVASVNLKALPDGGVRLLKQVQDLEHALGSLSLSSKPVAQPGRDEEMRPKLQPDPENALSRAGLAEGNRGVKPLSFHGLPPSAMGLPGLTMSQNYSSLYGVTPQWQSLYGGRMTEERLFAVRNATSETIDHLHKSLESCPGPENTAGDPRGIKVPLLLHQKQALAWLQWRETQQPQGGILADDMGLGKTLTMIALILAQKQSQKSEKEEEKKLESWISKTDSTLTVSRGTLIICPASLIHHWKKEVEKRVSDGRLRVYLYHGANREKDCKMLAQYDIVVTTYSLVSKEIPAKKEEGEAPAQDQDLEDRAASSPLLRLAWTRIILDEAHNIKNPKVQTSIAVCKLRAGARWAVTGTPIQNNLLDLYSLLRFLRCSPFDEFKLWKSQVDNGSMKGGERLTILTKSLLLRRMKDQLDHTGRPLVELPQRKSERHELTLSSQEQAVYDVIFARSRSTLQHYLKRHEGASHAAPGSADNPFDRVAREFGPSQGDVSAPPLSQGSSTVHILSLLLRLRQCCCHLSLLKTTLDQLELKNEGLNLTLEEQLNALTLCDLQSPDPKSTVSLNGTNFQAEPFESDSGSTKIDALISRLRTINSGSVLQKSVIVSQWTSMLRIVAVHLKRIGISHATIDGSINPKLRMDIVEEFNNNPRGPQVVLVSLCAGGVGLNLIGGNHLFLMDMHWNPALEDQACDRIYRVGQRKDVVIHRFVCQGTVEEKISQLQEKKKDLAKKVLTGNGSTFTKLTLTDLRLLFGV